MERTIIRLYTWCVLFVVICLLDIAPIRTASQTVINSINDLTVIDGIDKHPQTGDLAISGYDGRSNGIFIFKKAGDLLRFIPTTNYLNEIYWSPNAMYVATDSVIVKGGIGQESAYEVYDVTNGTLVSSTPYAPVTSQRLIWDMTSTRFAAAERNWINVYDAFTGMILSVYEQQVGLTSELISINWDRERKRLYGLTYRKLVYVWDEVTTDVIASYPLPDFPIAMALSDDGSTMAISLSSGQVIILDPLTGIQQQVIDQFVGEVLLDIIFEIGSTSRLLLDNSRATEFKFAIWNLKTNSVVLTQTYQTPITENQFIFDSTGVTFIQSNALVSIPVVDTAISTPTP